MTSVDCSKKRSLAPSLIDRLSNRFSIGNRLARLSTNWGLPDALARLGLADPSEPLHPAPSHPQPQPSPITEETEGSSEAAADDVGNSVSDGDDQAIQGSQEATGQQQQQQQQLEAVHDNRPSTSPQQSKQQIWQASSAFLKQRLSSQQSAAVPTPPHASSSASGMTPSAQLKPADVRTPPGRASAAGRAALGSLRNAQPSPAQSELSCTALARGIRQAVLVIACM